jgi:hypothetical protein
LVAEGNGVGEAASTATVGEGAAMPGVAVAWTAETVVGEADTATTGVEVAATGSTVGKPSDLDRLGLSQPTSENIRAAVTKTASPTVIRCRHELFFLPFIASSLTTDDGIVSLIS